MVEIKIIYFEEWFNNAIPHDALRGVNYEEVLDAEEADKGFHGGKAVRLIGY